MLSYTYQSLMYFRKMFSRNSTWVAFCMVILGFMGTHDMRGVTSFCRFWGLGESAYNSFLHFFRKSVWSLDALVAHWSAFVLSQNETVCADGRIALIGDHTCVAKDGRRMPCVVSMHQHSETQSRPSYFRGHYWGAITMLIGSMASPFCIPLALGIHQGLVHVGENNQTENDRETLGTRIIQMAIDFSVRHDLRSILTLDAFFPKCGSFQVG
jgi:hypothetical protein